MLLTGYFFFGDVGRFLFLRLLFTIHARHELFLFREVPDRITRLPVCPREPDS
jgi:hypothetical protein